MNSFQPFLAWGLAWFIIIIFFLLELNLLPASKVPSVQCINILFCCLTSLHAFSFLNFLFYCFLLTHPTLKELDPNQPQKLQEDQKRVGTECGFAVVWSGQESCGWYTVVGGWEGVFAVTPLLQHGAHSPPMNNTICDSWYVSHGGYELFLRCLFMAGGLLGNHVKVIKHARLN